jgi:hypothetical protein
VATMAVIKRAMDPQNILNPGKIIDIDWYLKVVIWVSAID